MDPRNFAQSTAQRDEQMENVKASWCNAKNENAMPFLIGTPEEENKKNEEEEIQR